MPSGISWQVSSTRRPPAFITYTSPSGRINRQRRGRSRHAASSFRAIGSAKTLGDLDLAGCSVRPSVRVVGRWGAGSGRIQSLEGTDRMPLGHSHIAKGTKNKTTPSFPRSLSLLRSMPLLRAFNRPIRSAKLRLARPEEMIFQLGSATTLRSVGWTVAVGGGDDLVRMFVSSSSSRNSEISLSRGRRRRWRRWRGRGGRR